MLVDFIEILGKGSERFILLIMKSSNALFMMIKHLEAEFTLKIAK